MVQANSTAPDVFVCKDQGAQAETESRVEVWLNKITRDRTGLTGNVFLHCYMRESYRLELFVDK